MEKWHFSIGFDVVLKLKTDEKLFLGATKKNIEEKDWSKKSTLRLVSILF